MIIALFLLQFLIGFGVLSSFHSNRHLLNYFSLAFLLGSGLSSFVPFLLDLLHIRINSTNIIMGLVPLLILSIFLIFKNAEFLKNLLKFSNLSVRIYELPFFFITGYFMYISFWKCYFYPNIPFDTMVGSDLIARATFLEGTLRNSVYLHFFTNANAVSNQPYYAPFVMIMEVVFLNLGDTFGKVWLSAMVLAFFIYFYFELKNYIHPIYVGWLMLFLWFMPELFAYTYLIQTDYVNAIFMLVAVSVFQRYYDSSTKNKSLLLSSIFFGFACWSRTETILFLPIAWLILISKEQSRLQIKRCVQYSLIPLSVFFYWNNVFLGIFVPKAIKVGVLNLNFTNYGDRLISVINPINAIIFDTDYWNYSYWIVFILALATLLIYRKREEIIKFFWILGLYIIFILIILHIEGANVPFTFRRGFFKIIFLTFFYVGTSKLLRDASAFIYKFAGEKKIIS
jgi:hypothetical protein